MHDWQCVVILECVESLGRCIFLIINQMGRWTLDVTSKFIRGRDVLGLYVRGKWANVIEEVSVHLSISLRFYYFWGIYIFTLGIFTYLLLLVSRMNGFGGGFVVVQ